MTIIRTCLAVLFVLSCASAASAQAVKIQFNDGLVSLSAQNVPLRTILTEWTRQGGTRFVNAERITGGPVTVEFTDLPERVVLDSLLRTVSGYMLAPRREGSTARSSFDSILIVPTSVAAPRPVSVPAPGSQRQPTTFRPPVQIPPVAFDPDDPEENPPGDIAPDDPEEDLPRGPRRIQRINPNVPGDPIEDQEDPDLEPIEEDPGPPPDNPFGVRPGSARPGEITPVPRRNQDRDEPDEN